MTQQFSLSQRVKLAARLLMGKNIPLDSLSHTRRDIPSISAEEVAEAKLFFPLDKFFIFGHARSGTTVLTRLIRILPEVHCNYQAHFFTRRPLLQSMVSDPSVGEWLSRPSNRWNRGSDLSPVVLRAAADFILEREARQTGVRIIGDKSPNSLLDGEAVELMHKIYPDGRLIYIVRDGRDAALSHRFQAFIDFPERLSAEDLRIRQAFIEEPRPFLSGERSVFTPKAIRQAAHGWVRNVRETDQKAHSLFGRAYISLRYEDLLADHREQMERLWRFLGASEIKEEIFTALHDEMNRNPDAEWQRQKAGEIAQALQKGKRGSWREMFTDNDRQTFQEIAGETLRAWEYKD